MRIALSSWQGRIAPVFDVNRRVEVIHIHNGQIAGRDTLPLPAELAGKLRELASGTITHLICGAISRPLQDVLVAHNIGLIAFVAGDVEEVLAAFLDNRLDTPAYAMPGCCGRRRQHRGHQHGCRPDNPNHGKCPQRLGGTYPPATKEIP